jgi:hypothetical protein
VPVPSGRTEITVVDLRQAEQITAANKTTAMRGIKVLQEREKSIVPTRELPKLPKLPKLLRLPKLPGLPGLPGLPVLGGMGDGSAH